MTRQEAVEFLAKLIADETEAQHQLDGNIDQELDTFGDEVRKRAWDLYRQNADPEPDGDRTLCRECGELCFVDGDTGTSHHWSADSIDDIDHDADADHVAIPEPDEGEAEADAAAPRSNLTVKEYATLFGVSAATVYAMCASGKLPHVRLGVGRGTIRIPLREETQ